MNTLPKEMHLGELDLSTVGSVKEEEEKKEEIKVDPNATPPIERII